MNLSPGIGYLIYYLYFKRLGERPDHVVGIEDTHTVSHRFA